MKLIEFKTFNESEEIETEKKTESLSVEVSKCVTTLMNASISFHKLHLKVTGQGSYAQHKGLNDIYDALPGFADGLAESYQGANEELLKYDESLPKILNTKQEGILYAQELKDMISNLQNKMIYSEIINDLDVVKSQLNSLKYKLLFLS